MMGRHSQIPVAVWRHGKIPPPKHRRKMPTFGSKIVTPPGNRRPVTLFAGQHSPQKSPSGGTVGGQGVRGAGVGSDVDANGFEHGDGIEEVQSPPKTDCTLTTADLVIPVPAVVPKSDSKFPEHHPKLSQIRESLHEDSRYSRDGAISPQVQSPDGTALDPHNKDNSMRSEALANKSSSSHEESHICPKKNKSAHFLDSSDLASRTPSPGLEISDINLSTITKLVTGKSAAGDEEDLVGAIMKMSQAKVMAKQNSRERRKAAVESHRASSDSSDVESVRESPRSRSRQSDSRENRESHGKTSMEPVRRPADGKAAQQQDTTGQARRGSQSDLRQRTSQNKPTVTKSRTESVGKYSRGQGGDRQSVGRHSGIPQPGKRPGAAVVKNSSVSDSRKLSANSEHNESRRSSRSSSSQKTSTSSLDQRRDSGTKIPVRRKSSIEETHPGVKDAAPVPSQSEQVESQQAQPACEFSGNSLSDDVLSKEALAQLHKERREKLQNSQEAKFDTDSESDLGSSSEPEFKWKSPRPSSVLTRSQRQSSDSEADRIKKSQAWWDDPDRTPVKKGTTAPRRVQFQQESNSLHTGSTDSSRSNSPHHDLETPPVLDSQKAKGSELKWLSSTPKEGFQAYRSQESLSQIVASPRDSFTAEYPDPSLYASQDNTAKSQSKTLQSIAGAAEHCVAPQSGPGLPSSQPSIQLPVSSPCPAQKSLALYSQQQSFVDTSMKPTQLTNHSITTTAFASQFLASSTNSTALPPNQLDNDTLKRSTGQGFSLNRVPQPTQGVFKVPQLPAPRAVLAPSFDDRPSLSFMTTRTTIGEESFLHASNSPSKHAAMMEDDKENELKPFPRHLEVRDSLPGPPSNHSTPLILTNRSQLGAAQVNRESFMPDLDQPEQKGQRNRDHPAKPTPAVALEAPTEVRIPGVCCVGLSTQGCIPMKNPTQRWLHVHLELITLSFDGDEHDVDGAVPFVLKEKLFLEPGKSEDVTVVFVPRQAGAYVAQLRLVVNPVVAEQVTQVQQVPKVITIQALAENPSIQVLTGGRRNFVDFGAIPWACQKGMGITLINKGRANIPVRLVISSNNSAWQCFTFERYPSPDVSIVSNQSRPTLPSLVPTICNHILPASENDADIKPVQVAVYFKAPPRQYERGMMGSATEDFSGRIMIEVDTPSKLITLGSIELTAVVGTARLHTPTNTEVISLKTQNGKVASRVIPLRNAGNIPIEVSVEVTHWPDFFTVVPMETTMEPGGQSEVVVKFEPKDTTVNKYESLLLMFVEPDGPSYEIQLEGEVCIPPPLPSLQGAPRAPMLLSNKHYMSWGGVAIGQSKEQRLTLKNAAEQMIKLLIQIRGKTTEFQLQTSFGQKTRLVTSMEILLRPLEEYPVRVMYTPTSTAWSEAKLQIKQNGLPLKYTIPLTAYGGTAQLKLEDVNSNKRNYCWKALGQLTACKSVAVVITVHNHGSRPAFVKALCFQDLACKRRVKSGQVSVEPNEFCLQHQESQQVTVAMSPTERDVSMCMEKAAIVSSVAFFYGDELSRQLYQICLRKSKKPLALANDNPLKNVDFDVPYLNEEKMCEGYELKPVSGSMELFYSSMSRLSLALVGSPPALRPIHTTPVPPLATLQPQQVFATVPVEPNTLKTAPVETEDNKIRHPVTATSPPVRDTNKNGVSPRWEPEEIEWWTLKPEELTLRAGHKGESPAIRKVQVTNYTDKPMPYELIWPGHCISVSPEQGTIPARNFVIVCVSISPKLRQCDVQLPWTGKIHVTCNKENKSINVQISDEESLDCSPLVTLPAPDPLPTAVISPQTPRPVVPLMAMTTSSKKGSLDLSKPTQQIDFPPTVVKSESNEHLEIRNTQPFPIKWTVSSFTPPYFKSPEDSSDIHRMQYAVFWLSQQSGSLEPYQRVQLPITFGPREKGHFSQFWEIRSEALRKNDLDLYPPYICKLELLAEAIPKPISVTKMASGDQNSGEMSVKSQVLSRDQLLIIRPNVLKFHTSSPGDSSQSKVQLRNRSQEDVEMLEFLPPEEPFRVKFEKVSVKMQHYMRVPVDFKPKKSGIFHTTLKMRRPSGEIIEVRLEGVCG